MENFITGYPGHEAQHRAAMLEVLGQEKYEFFFDKFLEYFFTEADAKFFASLGLNCIRLPFNYRHFEDDMNPRVLKESGFKHLDRVVELCAKHKIYTILDMHALPGGHNSDWHSDNPSNYAAFWDHKDFQDRTVWLWCELAKHYKGNPWFVGFCNWFSKLILTGLPGTIQLMSPATRNMSAYLPSTVVSNPSFER